MTELKAKSAEIIQSEEQEENRMKRNEQVLRAHGTPSTTTACITGVSEREEIKGSKRIFEDICAKAFQIRSDELPYSRSSTNYKQNTRTQITRNPPQDTPLSICQKSKTENLESGEKHSSCTRLLRKSSSLLLIGIHGGQRQWKDLFKVLKE